MLNTTPAAERRRSTVHIDGHESPGHVVPDGCDDTVQRSVDRKLMDAVVRALHDTGQPALRGVEIEISGGIVILWGRVPSYYQKQLAQEAAQRVSGIQGIANGLEVVCCR